MSEERIEPRRRPGGVTFLGVAAFLAGITSVGLAILMIFAASFVLGYMAGDATALIPQMSAIGITTGQFFSVATGLFLFTLTTLVVGFAYFPVGIGFLRGSSWAWPVGIVITGVNVMNGLGLAMVVGAVSLVGVVSASILVGIVPGIVLVYLFTPGVRTYFGYRP